MIWLLQLLRGGLLRDRGIIMVYKKIQNVEGDYKDKQAVRWDLLEAHEAWTPEGINVGWTEFDDIETCMIAWGLVYDPILAEEQASEASE